MCWRTLTGSDLANSLWSKSELDGLGIFKALTFGKLNAMSRRSNRDLRACILCSIVLPMKEFADNGCPNCQDLFTNVHDGTTSNWEGAVALINPTESWVSKWQGLTNYVPGCYAVRYSLTIALY